MVTFKVEHSMAETISFIKISNLNKTYGLFSKFQALSDINLNIQRGETFGLIGPNGAGKTTLMGCLLGLLKPTSGNILIDNKEVDDISVKAKTGFMPERPNFDAWMIVENFLHYHHMLAQQPAQNAEADVARVLSEVGLEAVVSKRLIRKLSRGMLQRLGLAQLLVGNPEICFLDEPTSGMDPLGMSLMQEMLNRWKQEGKTVIINSHHLDQVEKVCDRVAFIDKGKIGSVEELSPTEKTKQVFVIHWAKPYPSIDRVRKIAQDNNLHCMADIESNSKFLLTNKSEGGKLLRVFIDNDLNIEEAIYERKDLVELFKKDNNIQ
jgi:ABC-2 type transport system ATP-binding protein